MTKSTDADKINQGLHILLRFGQIDGDHHKAWAIDQAVRFLAGDRYDQLIKDHCEGWDGPNTYSWDVGIAP